MTHHRATEEQWASVIYWSTKDEGACSCLRELRARVEALEDAQRPSLDKPLQLTPEQEQAIEALLQPTPNHRQIRSSLVERVALAICGIEYNLERDEEAVNWASEARAAIREVEAALRAQCFEHAADWLEKEAER